MKKRWSTLILLLSALPLFSQSVNFTHLNLSVIPDTLNQAVNGWVVLSLRSQGSVDSIYLNGVQMDYQEVLLNDVKVNYAFDDSGIWLLPARDLPDSSWISIKYQCQPRKGIYFIGWQDATHRAPRQIWTQGQGIDHRHWIPHRDDQTDKVKVKIEVAFSADYEVMANGRLTARKIDDSGMAAWTYQMEQPMSTYLIALVIGKYDSLATKSNTGIPLKQYFYPERSDDYDWYYRHNEEIFNFLEENIGVPFPWQNYKQAPVQDFRHGAMENTTATIFGDFFLVDSIAFNDENYTYVNAHELAHQWFGNLVTATGSDEHWLHEGFATYYQWLSEQNIYGYDKADWDRQTAAALVFEASKIDTIPLGNGQAGSARFYQKGAWVLHMLHRDLGDSLFKASITNYLKRYAFGLVTTDSLQASIRQISGTDYSEFFERWVYQAGEPILEIESHREQNRIRFAIHNLYRPSPHLPLKIPVMLQKAGGASTEFLNLPVEDTVLYLDLPNQPVNHWVINPDMAMLADFTEVRETDEWLKMYPMLANLLDRYQVLVSLRSNPAKEKAKFLRMLAADPAEHYRLRAEALAQLISAGDKKARSLAQMAFQGMDVQLQKEVIVLLPQEWRDDLRASVLPLLRSASYELRARAVHYAVDLERAGNNSWLNDELFEQQPGIPGNKLLIPVLFYRSYLLQDHSAADQLIDLSGASYDFITRINAIMTLSNLGVINDTYVLKLFKALFDLNWKLSGTAKTELKRLYATAKGREMIEQVISENSDSWEDFQKRRVQRTFELN